jgi:hypothetical protein
MCFVNGDLSINSGGVNLLIVCNGDAKIGMLVHDAVILCTGDIHHELWTRKCLFVAGGEVKIDPNGIKEGSHLYAKEKRLAEVVTFYDCRDGGLEVAPADKAVRVTAADPAKAFGKAGLRPGDVIDRVDGLPAPDPRTFNKLLCRAAVGATGEAELHVRRGDQALDVVVPVPE